MLEVYNDGKGYKIQESLRGAVYDFFMNLKLEYIQNLYSLLPRSCVSVLDCKGAVIDY